MSNPHVKKIEIKRRQWRKDQPYGFIAHPIKLEDGTLNLFNWHCVIPGPRDTVWCSGYFALSVFFPSDKSQRLCIQFVPRIFHPNVNRVGKICSAITASWPSESIKQILYNVQDLLHYPNINAPENTLAAMLYQNDYMEYERRVKSNINVYHSWNYNL